MVSERRFFKIIRESKDINAIAVTDEVINSFHNYIPSSYVLYIIGQIEFNRLYEEETKTTFPLLKEICNFDLDIWAKLGVDKKIAKEFVDFISQEKELRANNGDWAELKKVIYPRIELYPVIFKFTKEDISFCEMSAEEFKKLKEKK